jgi:hypothetical protein
MVTSLPPGVYVADDAPPHPLPAWIVSDCAVAALARAKVAALVTTTRAKNFAVGLIKAFFKTKLDSYR